MANQEEYAKSAHGPPEVQEDFSTVSVARLSGELEEVRYKKSETVAELRRRVEEQLDLAASQACRLINSNGEPLWDHVRLEELPSFTSLGAIVVKRHCFAMEAPMDFTQICVNGFGNMTDKYMQVSDCGQIASNPNQEDSRAELLFPFRREDLPVSFSVRMPDSGGYAHFLYVRSGKDVVAVEANKAELFSVDISQDRFSVSSSGGPVTKTLLPEMDLDAMPLRFGVYLYRQGTAELRTDFYPWPGASEAPETEVEDPDQESDEDKLDMM